MERRPDWLLLSTTAVAGRNRNVTTATNCTRNGKTIEVSLSLEHPPHPSLLFVHSSDMNPGVAPEIVRTVEDLLLLSVNLGSRPLSLSPIDCDYFIYRAHPSCPPSLQRLPHPNAYFNNNDIGVLPRSDGQYTVAVLLPVPTISIDRYELHLFHSQIQSWSCITLSVEAPQQPFPVKIPRRSSQLHQHLTSTVITIGGEGGTMGWVDLWRGILFCDVLEHRPSLRGVPLPLPLNGLGYDYGEGAAFGPGWQRRGITFVREKACLKLVHLEINATRLPFRDPETGAFFRVVDWALTTWSNKEMTNSYEAWHQDSTVQASEIRIDNPAVSQALESGLLKQRPQDHGVAGDHRLGLQNLTVSQPGFSVNGEDIIYLVATKKYKHPESWILTVDMENAKVQAVDEFAGQSEVGLSVIHQPSIINKYMMNPATTPGVTDAM